MAADRAKLRKQVEDARASLISKGGNATLRFIISGGTGTVQTNSRHVAEALCALWNAAPELLAPLEIKPAEPVRLEE